MCPILCRMQFNPTLSLRSDHVPMTVYSYVNSVPQSSILWRNRSNITSGGKKAGEKKKDGDSLTLVRSKDLLGYPDPNKVTTNVKPVS